jgi:hypothetical protein
MMFRTVFPCRTLYIHVCPGTLAFSQNLDLVLPSSASFLLLVFMETGSSLVPKPPRKPDLVTSYLSKT